MLDLSTVPRLPPKTSSLGPTTVEWQEVEPGIALIYTKEGSYQTRHLATLLLAYDLEACGYQIYRGEMPSFTTRQATWTDVQNKAIRLFRDGHVTLQKNGLQEVIGSVVGDHGVYTAYITRSDPNSAVWTQSNCTCPWSQFKYDRTRIWKKYEGRPCWMPGSRLTLANGTYLPIEEAIVGLDVLSNVGISTISHVWENDYDGLICKFKRRGSSHFSSVTEDHNMLVVRASHFIGTKGNDAKGRILAQEGNWQKTKAKDVRVGDWLKLAYPTEVKLFQLDVASFSPYFHINEGRVYKSVFTKDHPKFQYHQKRTELVGEEFLADMALVERAYSYVSKTDGCWIWNGPMGGANERRTQPLFGYDSRLCNPKHIIWAKEKGPRAQGSILRRTCDNILCVNPDHMCVKDQTKWIGQHAKQTMPPILTASDALLTIVGYYLAEGSLANNGNVVEWSFHRKEVSYINALEQALRTLNAGELHKYYPGKNKTTVKAHNAILAEVLAYLCGRYSHNKKLSPELMLLDPERQRFLLERYAEGDAHIPESGRSFVASTASDELAQQLVQMGCRVYETLPAWHKSKNSGGPTNRSKELKINAVKMDPFYNVGQIRLEPGYYAACITDIQYEEYKGSVYNVTVPPSFTVTVDDIVSFQCAHLMALAMKSATSPLDDETQQEPSFGQMPQQQQLPDMAPQQPGVATYPPNAAPSSDFNVLNQNDPWANAQPLQPSMSPPYVTQEPLLQIPQQYEDYQKQLQDQTQNAPISIVQTNPPYPGNPMDSRGTLSHIIYADQGMQFQQGDTVRINVATMAQKEGPVGAVDQGQWIDIARNSQGEVFDVDAGTGWVVVLFPMPGVVPMTVPYDIVANNARAYVESDMLTLVNRGGLKSPLVGNPNRNQSLT